ncbi:MAG: YggS family pyridoxal phosphate-dependent enzyme [Pseudomarimonas sp.]
MPDSLSSIRQRLAQASLAAGRGELATLLAVSKTQPAAAIRDLAAAGQVEFGENYVQEAAAKRCELADLGLHWHLIGHLQSNKCRLAAEVFDWVQSVDRISLVEGLAKARPLQRGPLNVLIQVDIDAEASKSGCRPDEVAVLADAIAVAPTLHLRGLMAIPAPHADLGLRALAFRRMRVLFESLRGSHPSVDTLSMGMSEDFELAVAEGATMVRVGSALFGPRVPVTAAAGYSPLP